LWFNNSTNEKVNKLLKKKVKEIPSKKFLPLIYQIASRMSTDNTSLFQDVLNTIIETTALDHPHHVLYQIFALSNGEAVSEGSLFISGCLIAL